MTLFELVRVTLDELYHQAQEEYGTATDETVRTRIQHYPF
jgi:hypothetical protein